MKKSRVILLIMLIYLAACYAVARLYLSSLSEAEAMALANAFNYRRYAEMSLGQIASILGATGGFMGLAIWLGFTIKQETGYDASIYR